MAKVNWTFQALDDLSDIGEYLSENSETYADYMVNLIWEKGNLLKDHPKLGKIVPESNIPNLREIIIKKYRIIYSLPKNDHIDILAIRHSSMR